MVLNIRKLDPEVHRRLRVRAAEHGRSMEAEARAILEAAVAEPALPGRPGMAEKVRDLQAWVKSHYLDRGENFSLVDEFIAEKREEARREEEEWDRW